MNIDLSNLLPAAWVAAQRELEAQDIQREILTDALQRLLALPKPDDAVVEALLSAIDAVDAVELAVTAEQIAGGTVDSEPDIAGPDDSERGIRQRVIAELRAEGYVGAGFDVLVTAKHRDLAELDWERAENDLRGKLVRTEYQADYSARKLWFCTDRELRKYASDELLAWFDQYGRLTRAQLSDNLLGRRHYHGSGYFLA
jgi:hypothetical protein